MFPDGPEKVNIHLTPTSVNSCQGENVQHLVTISCEVLNEDVSEPPWITIFKNNSLIANLTPHTLSNVYQLKKDEAVTSDSIFTCRAGNKYEQHLDYVHQSQTITVKGKYQNYLIIILVGM